MHVTVFFEVLNDFFNEEVKKGEDAGDIASI